MISNFTDAKIPDAMNNAAIIFVTHDLHREQNSFESADANISLADLAKLAP